MEKLFGSNDSGSDSGYIVFDHSRGHMYNPWTGLIAYRLNNSDRLYAKHMNLSIVKVCMVVFVISCRCYDESGFI